jgi:hypothetical protein
MSLPIIPGTVTQPTLSAPNLHTAIKTIRKYDGCTDGELWLDHLNRDIVDLRLTTPFVISNLDRFFEGNAAAWWSRAGRKYRGGTASDGTRWNNFVLDFKNFFGKSAIRKAAEVKNETYIYNRDTTPQTYVTHKLQILDAMDPEMKETEVVRQLLKGLPSSLAQAIAVTVTDATSANDVLQKLESITEFNAKSRDSNPGSSSRHTGSRSQTTDSHSSNYLNQRRDVPTCNHCNRRGHTQDRCFELHPELRPQRPDYAGQENPRGRRGQYGGRGRGRGGHQYPPPNPPPNQSTDQNPPHGVHQVGLNPAPVNKTAAIQNLITGFSQNLAALSEN